MWLSSCASLYLCLFSRSWHGLRTSKDAQTITRTMTTKERQKGERVVSGPFFGGDAAYSLSPTHDKRPSLHCLHGFVQYNQLSHLARFNTDDILALPFPLP